MIAQAIARYLDAQGTDISLLSEETGLGQEYIQRALRGEHNFSIDDYEKICLALNLPLSYFFDQAPPRGS